MLSSVWEVSAPFLHDAQPKTCRRCGAADHISRDCINEVCFNCDGIGHVSRSCPEKMKCCFCKSEDHKAIDCPLLWYRCSASHRDAPPDESGPGPRVDADPSLLKLLLPSPMMLKLILMTTPPMMLKLTPALHLLPPSTISSIHRVC